VSSLFSALSHDPRACADALRGAAPKSEVIIDLETTGLGRRHRIVSVGVFVAPELYILFTGSVELSVVKFNIPLYELKAALQPLAERDDVVAVLHNAEFDLGFLMRAGIELRCPVHDTERLMRMIDSDRGRAEVGRTLRRTGLTPNYRLKDLVEAELNIIAPHFPGAAELLPYREHVRYLISDLLITSRLYRHTLSRLTQREIDYYRSFVAPVTPLLVGMNHIGVRADAEFIVGECGRLLGLMRQLSDHHFSRFGQALDAGDFHLRGYLYFRKDGLRCYVDRLSWVKVGGKSLPPLDSATLTALREGASRGSRRHESLGLIMDYLLIRGLMIRLATLRDKHIDSQTGRIHSVMSDRQSSGRITSTQPNLQGIANIVRRGGKRELVSEMMSGVEIRSRNALCATDGFTLAAFDIAQADIRCLAAVTEQLTETGAQLVERLESGRSERLRGEMLQYSNQLWDHYREQNRKPVNCPLCGTTQAHRRLRKRQHVCCPQCGAEFDVQGRVPHFDPTDLGRLAADFREGGPDFYTAATKRMLGRPPRDKQERNAMKQVVLGIVNAMSAHGLAAKLSVDVDTAKTYLSRFAEAYPKESAYIELMYHAAAITGHTETIFGRRRRVTPHYWMVNESELDLFVSYRGADKLWVRVAPLSASRHTLTCWIKSVVDAKYDSPRLGQEIYHHRDGRISQAPYRFFDDDQLIFTLPARNVSWRLIRRVRTTREESRYQGFDTTRRQLVNHIFQGSTADVARLMMIRSQPLCREFGARLLLQIHDEVLFEIPGNERRVMQFVRAAVKILQLPPSPEFSVPIVVEPKIGKRFGELRELELWEYAAAPPLRWWRLFTQWIRSRWRGAAGRFAQYASRLRTLRGNRKA
jgi:DNA polymerase I-like protein with 3'-5' exonuclease and polymerase domains/ribosomal protein L37AE/L43A